MRCVAPRFIGEIDTHLPSTSIWPAAAYALTIVNIFVVNVVLLNLLIAVMGGSYERVVERAEQSFYQLRAAGLQTLSVATTTRVYRGESGGGMSNTLSRFYVNDVNDTCTHTNTYSSMATVLWFTRTHTHSRARNRNRSRAGLILKYERRLLSTKLDKEEGAEGKFLHVLMLAEDSSDDQSDMPGVVNAMKRQLREQVSTNVFTITILLLPLDSVIAPK